MPLIRAINTDEHAFLKEMLYEAIFRPEGKVRPPRSFLDEPHVARYYEGFGREGDVALMLEVERELMGAVWARRLTECEKGYGFVDASTPELSMAIRPEFRNRGFGRQLLETLFEQLRAANVGQVSLSVDTRNPAVRLYRRCGFEVVAESGTAFTMLKKL
jgi:ribosomal protein S18 acetylase RimI-like enzyme